LSDAWGSLIDEGSRVNETTLHLSATLFEWLWSFFAPLTPHEEVVKDVMKELGRVRREVSREYQWLQGLGVKKVKSNGETTEVDELKQRKRLIYLFVKDMSRSADYSNQLIRMIIISTANVSSLAGLASSSGSTNGVGSNALFRNPQGVSVSSDGSYALVTDQGNHLIRKIVVSTGSPTGVPSSSSTTAPTSSSSKYGFGVVFGDPESQGLRVGSALLLDYFIGDQGLIFFKCLI
jgi:hypothetical protein